MTLVEFVGRPLWDLTAQELLFARIAHHIQTRQEIEYRRWESLTMEERIAELNRGRA